MEFFAAGSERTGNRTSGGEPFGWAFEKGLYKDGISAETIEEKGQLPHRKDGEGIWR